MLLLSDRFRNDAKPTLTLNDLQRKTIAELQKKIERGAYQEERVPCECGSINEEVLAEKDRYGIAVRTVICTNCGLLRSNPRLTNVSLNEFYNTEYRKIYVGAEDIPESYKQKEYMRGKKILEYLLHYKAIAPDASVLEIGAGAGGNLLAFQEAGHRVLGVDIGAEYVKKGSAERDIELIVGTSDVLLPKYRNSFSVILLCHALEHFTDIKKELGVIKELLRKDGALYIEVPGIKNLTRSYQCDFLRFLQNAHLYHFTLGTLAQTTARHGFSIVAGDEQVRSIFKHDSGYSHEHINHYPEVGMFLRNLERKRWLYKIWGRLKSVSRRVARRIIG